ELLRPPEELSVFDRDRRVIGKEGKDAEVAYIERRPIDPVHRDEDAERRVTHLEGSCQAGGCVQSGQRVGLRTVARIGSHIGYVERLPFENDPPGNAALALDVVPLEVVELAVVRNPSRVLPHLPPLDGYEEDRLRVEDLEGTVQDRFENSFLRTVAVDMAGNL